MVDVRPWRTHRFVYRNRLAALLTRSHGRVRDGLEDLELVPVGAAVLVDRHREAIIAAPRGATWQSIRRSAGAFTG